MAEGISNNPSEKEIKGSKHTSTSRTPSEFRGAHTLKPDTSQPLTDQQIEDDFLAAFAPLESISEPHPIIQNPQSEIHVGIKESDDSPSSIVLPKGTVVYDEDGEAYKIDEFTEVDGSWFRPPKSKGGPARFIISTIYPNGRDADGKKVNGQYALRKGKLWYGQTTSGKNPSDR